MQLNKSKYKISQGTNYMQWKRNSAEIKAECNVKIAEGASQKDSTRCKMHGI